MAKYEDVKNLLEMATTVEKVEQIMSEHTAFETLEEKIDFLKDMFEVKIVAETADSDKEITYYAILNAIVTKKFRC